MKRRITANIRNIVHGARNAVAVFKGTLPGSIFFHHEIEQFLGVDAAWIQATAAEYRVSPAAWKLLSGLRSPSRKTDGVAKTLDVAEGFALWALVKHIRPRVVVELGSQYGISARLWKEALKRYVPNHSLFLCDLEDQRRFIGDDESTMLQGDARETLQQICATYTIDILHNDAHPYDLIRWSIEEGLRQGIRIFTFHDVGKNHARSVFKPQYADLSIGEKTTHATDWQTYGLWERHAVAELFDQRAIHEDAVENTTCRIQFFDSLFGFGAVAIKHSRAAANEE